MIDIVLKYVHHLFDLPMTFLLPVMSVKWPHAFLMQVKLLMHLEAQRSPFFLDMWILLAVGLFLAYQNINLFLCSLVVVPIYILIVWLFKKLLIV